MKIGPKAMSSGPAPLESNLKGSELLRVTLTSVAAAMPTRAAIQALKDAIDLTKLTQLQKANSRNSWRSTFWFLDDESF